MTIDSTWIASFKEEIPQAFTQSIPFRPKAAFCDGQIRLMRGHSGDFLTWDSYIHQQFTRHVQKFFDNHGVGTVILAFDDYAHVPEAKCMTQLKRRKHVPKLEILEREPLPTVCPSGEKWAQCISNRVFKSKVIALVVQTLPKLLRLSEEQTLVIDYAGPPDEYRLVGGQIQTRRLELLIPLGEADVKFTRYADMYKQLLVDSVDGDSIPIALLHHEAAIRELTNGSMKPGDLMDAPPKICIYRISTRLDSDKKRKADEGRKFEYVNVPFLYTALRDVILQCTARMDSPTHCRHYMSMLLALIGLTGTDYTRNMPQVSGKTVFGLLSSVWLPLMRSFNPGTGQLEVQPTVDHVVGCIYAIKYSSHLKTAPGSLKGILDTLQSSKLSQRTRDALPSIPRMACSVRNVNWLIRYWREPTCTPNPLENEAGVATFGFVKQNGVVGYTD